MDVVINWGLSVILWLQQFSPGLDSVFKGFSFLGTEDFAILLLPLMYWCVHRRFAVRLLVLFIISSYFGAYVKVLVNEPRPYEIDARVKALELPADRGFPSLHTQNAVVVWGFLAAAFRRTWLWVLACALIIFIPLSRMYLGVHFPTDLLGGYIFGGMILALGLWGLPNLEAWTAKKGLKWQVGITIISTLVLLVLFPTGEETGVTMAALGFSCGIGIAIERRWVRFASGGIGWKQIARLLLGLVIVLGLRYGLKAAFDGLAPDLVFRFIRYSIMGFWLVLGAPYIFIKLKLAEKE